MKKEVIVKVQVPLASDEVDAPAMIYAKGRKNQRFVPITPELEKAMGGQFKRFFNSIVFSNGDLEVLWNQPVADPGW